MALRFRRHQHWLRAGRTAWVCSARGSGVCCGGAYSVCQEHMRIHLCGYTALPRGAHKHAHGRRGLGLGQTLYVPKHLSVARLQCVLVIRESFTKEYGSRVFHSSSCGPLFLHIEPNQLSLITRTHCIRAAADFQTAPSSTDAAPGRPPVVHTWRIPHFPDR